VVYSLPAPYSAFKENGWTSNGVDLYSETVGSGKYEMIEMVNGEHTAYMGFINNREDDIELNDCHIGMLHVRETDAMSGVRALLPGGVTIGAGYDDIIALYGPATKRSDFGWGIVSLRYNELDSGLELELDAESMQVISINYKNFTGRNKLPIYTGPPPAVLNDYIAPENPGDSWQSLICRYGGDLYRLPVPAAELVNNGWIFVSDENYMLEPKGRIEEIEMRKDNQVLHTAMVNPDENAQPLKYCYILELSYDKHKTGISLELPGGINETSTMDELFETFGEPDITDESGSMFIYYTYGTNDYGIKITQSIESGLIVYLALYTQSAG
jgi:hypothetical protein